MRSRPAALLWVSVPGICLLAFTLLHNRPGNFSILPSPTAKASFISSGPYRFIRHPMYTSLLLIVLGPVLFYGHILNLVFYGVLLVVMMAKTRIEEDHLRTRFANYDEYSRATRRFLPFVY